MDSAAQKIMKFRAATSLRALEAKAFFETQPVELIERILRAGENRTGTNHLNDPIEEDPEIGPTVRKVLKEIQDVVTQENGGKFIRGQCHRIWQLSKDRLQKEYRIKWYSPREMNPAIVFD